MASRGSQNSNADSRSHSGTGYVTKVLDGFGLIDDSVYFSLNVVQGPPVKVGDMVMYESSFSEGHTFEWSAKFVKHFHGQKHDERHGRFSTPQQQPAQQHQAYSSRPPASSYHSGKPFSSQGPAQQHLSPQQPNRSGSFQDPRSGYGNAPPPPPPSQGNYPSPQRFAPPSHHGPPPSGPRPHGPHQGLPPHQTQAAPSNIPPPSSFSARQDATSQRSPRPSIPDLSKTGPNSNQGFFQYGHGGNQLGYRNEHPPRYPPPPQAGSHFQPRGPPPDSFGQAPHSFQGPPPRAYDPPGHGPGPHPPGGLPSDMELHGWHRADGSHQPPSIPHQDRFESRPNNRGENERGPPPPRYESHQPPVRKNRFDHESESPHQKPPPSRLGKKFSEFSRKVDEPRFHQGFDGGRDPRGREDRFSGKNQRDSKFDKDRRERDNKGSKRYKDKRSISPAHSSTSSVRSVPIAALPDKRRYESANLPKSNLIRSSYSAAALKDKIGFGTHVPSDLKELLLSNGLEFDFLNYPKGLGFEIKKESSSVKSLEATEVSEASTESVDIKPETLKHKFNVKILLLSVPSLNDIYRQVVGGAEFDHSNSVKTAPFLKHFTLLATRNSSHGFSLIGGRWCLEKDGLVKGSNQPNLIETAVRLSQEFLGINLKNCQKWRVFSTFIYNLDTNSPSEEPTYEITKVYIPDIWSCQADLLASRSSEIVTKPDEMESETAVDEPNKSSPTVDNEDEKDLQNSEEKIEDESWHNIGNVDETSASENDFSNVDKENGNIVELQHLQELRNSVDDLRVIDLKVELQKMGVDKPKSAKKGDLVKQLLEAIDEKEKSFSSQETAVEEHEGINRDISDVQLQEETESVGTEVRSEQDHSNDQQTVENRKEENMEDKVTSEQNELKEDGKKNSESAGGKRKVEDSNHGDGLEKESEVEVKKVKFEKKDEILLKGNDLSFVPLLSLNTPKRGDQFELIVVSHILRDALTLHFARYLFSSLISKSNMATKISIDNSSRAPVNYVHLAFSFFDRSACGSMNWDDLQTLFEQTGIYMSKKCSNQLHQIYGDRIDYRNFIEPDFLWRGDDVYPTVFNQPQDDHVIERNSVQYNTEQLIEHFETYRKYNVLSEQQSESSKNKVAQLEKTIDELLNKNKKIEKSLEKQSHDFADVKKERDQFRGKYDSLKKGIAALSDL